MSEQENKEIVKAAEPQVEPEVEDVVEPEIENEEKPEVTEKPESTLFSDPNTFYVDEKNRQPKRRNLLLTSLIALGAVALVVIAAFAIKTLVPTDDNGDVSSNSTGSIAVTEYVSDDVERMTVEGEDYKTVLYSQLDSTSSETTTVKWYVEGVDGALTDSFTIDQAVGSAVNMSALRIMDIKDANYGFDKPIAKVTVQSRNQKFGNYTITVGSVSPDRSGYYVKNSLSDEVYLVEKETVEKFCQDIYAYANTTVISALTDGDAPEEYFSESTLIKVDAITVRGQYYGKQVISFKTNPDENTAPFMTYVMTEPYQRYADNEAVKQLITPFSNGLYAERIYTYDASYEDIQKYGLVEPQIILTLKVGNIEHTIKATRNDDGYYAVMLDDCKAIYQLGRGSLSIGDTRAITFVSTVVFSEMLKTFKDIDVTVNGKVYDFNISVVESEDEADVYNVTAGSLPIEAENFQNYYAQLLGMTLTEISLETPEATPSMTVRLTRKNGTRTTITFAQTSDRRYHVSVDGDPGGYISTTTYEKLANYVALAYEGKAVPSVTQQ